MDKSISVTTLFVDIGGVLLTDGWGHEFRKMAVKEFHLNQQEIEDRHQMVFETFELDKLTMEEYLKLVIFYERRPFSPAQLKEFMFARSESDPANFLIDWLEKQIDFSLINGIGHRVVHTDEEGMIAKTVRQMTSLRNIKSDVKKIQTVS